MVSETDLAYLAGLIDGEGTVDIRRTRYKRRIYSYHARLRVTMKSKITISWIKIKFGGTINTWLGHKGTRFFAWEIKEYAAIAILQQAIYYLRLKHFQAAHVIAFFNDITKVPRSDIRRGVSVHELNKRQRYFEIVQKINSKKNQLHGINPSEGPILTQMERIAYLAALLDGEGDIGINRAYQYSRGKVRPNPSHTAYFEMRMTAFNIIKWVAQQFDTKPSVRKPAKGNTKRLLQFRVVGQKAVDILHVLFPYLKTKSFQAMTAIAFQCDRTPTKQGYRQTIPRHEMEKRDAYYLLMKRLNKREPNLK